MESLPGARPSGANPDPATRVSPVDLARSPLWFPLDALDGDTLRLLRLDEEAYRAASFLDQRLLRTNPPQGSCTTADLSTAASQLTPCAYYVFHIGHVGSTLVSRLIGEDPRFFCVREPALLRQVVLQPRRRVVLPALLALLSRTWRPRQRALVKASSFVSELAATILEATPGSKALLVYTPAVTYLRSILGGPNSRIESRALAPSRLTRLRRRLAPARIPEPRCEGEVIAMSWLCEMTALCQAAEGFSTRTHWLEFERFLGDAPCGLATAVTALGAAPDAELIEATLRGPLMRQYSKAPEHAYDPGLRRAVLQEAEREYGGEIRAGMRWLAGLRGSHRLADRALAL